MNSSIDTTNQRDKPSSDDDDFWMDDLPSPSLLLRRNETNNKFPNKADNPQAADKASFDDVSVFTHADHECDNFPTNLTGQECPRINLEASSVARDHREASTSPCQMIASNKVKNVKCVGSDDRLFFSTASPEKSITPLEKHNLGASVEFVQPKEKPIGKRRSRSATPKPRRCSQHHDFHAAKKRRISHSANRKDFSPSINDVGPFGPFMEARETINRSSEGSSPARTDELILIGRWKPQNVWK